jgi:hypothetical protein
VSKLGAIASLWYDPEDEEEEPPVGTFYSRSLVEWLRPEEA